MESVVLESVVDSVAVEDVVSTLKHAQTTVLFASTTIAQILTTLKLVANTVMQGCQSRRCATTT